MENLLTTAPAVMYDRGVRELQEPLRDKDQTGRRMYELAKRYAHDLDRVYKGRTPLSRIPLRRFYRLVRSIPYRRDNPPVEVVARPLHILTHAKLGMDCKKRAILLGAWAEVQRPPVPWRLVASSRRADRRMHHVFPQFWLGSWRNVDATYPDYRLFGRKTVTAAEVLRED